MSSGYAHSVLLTVTTFFLCNNYVKARCLQRNHFALLLSLNKQPSSCRWSRAVNYLNDCMFQHTFPEFTLGKISAPWRVNQKSEVTCVSRRGTARRFFLICLPHSKLKTIFFIWFRLRSYLCLEACPHIRGNTFPRMQMFPWTRKLRVGCLCVCLALLY